MPCVKQERESMNDVLSMAAADAQADDEIPEDKLERIRHFGERQRKLVKHISVLENDLNMAKEQLRRLQEQDLPEAMDEVGMIAFKLDDGAEIKVKAFYNASIPEERKEEAFDWLKENDFEGLIKGEVKVSFGKGEYEVAQAFLRFVRGFNQKSIDPEYKEHVHWQSLRAFVREQIEGGHPLPLETFGVFIGRKAELKLAK